MRDPKERLRDILEAIAAIERHLGGDKAAFERDELLQTWFLRHLQIIGEAARGLPPETRARADYIPWPKIIGMRNVLVHGYFDIDTDIVWQAGTRDVPELSRRSLVFSTGWITDVRASLPRPCRMQARYSPSMPGSAMHPP